MAKIYGICGDNKCRREVPSKEDFDAIAADTGWVTLVEAGTYGVFTLSEPLEYRVIGNKVHWRTRVQKVNTGAPPASQYTYSFGTNGLIPAKCIPKKGAQKTFIALIYGNTTPYTINVSVSSNGVLKFHIFGTTTVTTTNLDTSIGFEYFLD